MLFGLAIKTIYRQKRNIILLFSLALILSINIMIDSVSRDLIYAEQEVRNSFRLADLYVYAQNITPKDIEEIKSCCENIVALSPRYVFSQSIISSSRIYEVSIYGITRDPSVDTIPHLDWKAFVGKVAIVDRGLAMALGIRKGDKLSLFGEEFTVLDTMYLLWAGSLYYNGRGSIIIPIESLWQYVGKQGIYNTLSLRLKNNAKLPRTIYKLNKLFEEKNKTANFRPAFIGLEKIMESISGFYEAILLATTVMSIIILVLFAYLDISMSSRELSLMESIGFTTREILMLYIIKFIIISLIATSLSIAIGNFSGYLLARYAISVTYSLDIALPIISWFNPILVLLPLGLGLVSAIIILRVLFRKALYDYIRRDSEYNYSIPRVIDGGLFIKLAIRGLWLRKLRSLALVLIVVFSFGVSSSLLVVVHSGEQTYRDMADSFDWDLFVATYTPFNIDDLYSYVLDLGCMRVEKMFYLPVPLRAISYSGKSFSPPYGVVDIIGARGNESLLSFDIVGSFREGSYIILSEKIARILGAKIGDVVALEFIHPVVDRLVLHFEVSGIVRTSWGGGLLLMFDIRSLENYLNYSENTLLIKLENKSDIISFAGKINRYLVDRHISHHIITKFMISKNVENFARQVETWLVPLLIVVFVFVSLAVVGIMLSWFRRDLRLYSILMALGLDNLDVMKIVVLQHTIVFLLSFLLGLLVMISSANWLVNIIDDSQIFLWINLYFDYRDLLVFSALILGTFVLIEIISVLSILRIDLYENLKYE